MTFPAVFICRSRVALNPKTAGGPREKTGTPFPTVIGVLGLKANDGTRGSVMARTTATLRGMGRQFKLKFKSRILSSARGSMR